MKTASSNTIQEEELSYQELLEAYEQLEKNYASARTEHNERVASLQESNISLQESNSELWRQIQLLKRHVFGKRSEKLVSDERQGLLFEEEVPEPISDEDLEETEVPSYKRRKRGRKTLPENLPRERIEYEPEELSCSCCGSELSKIGEEITEELDYIPARFLVREHVKIKRACSKCKDGVSIGKLPLGTPVIDGARPGAGLLAHIILSKYSDSIPLHRQERIYERHGMELPRQRMCDWVGIVCERYLMPIALALRMEILQSLYVRADETRIKVQDLDKMAWLWGLLSQEGDLYFEYNRSRGGDVAKKLFTISENDFYSGFAQTDLYAGYNQVFLPEQTIRVGCWVHARRKYLEVQKTAKKECGVILKTIAQLYKLEDKLSVEDRYLVRQRKSKAVVDKLKKYLIDLQQRTLPKAPLSGAISYTLKQWEELTLFIEHPDLELDNNAIERQIRPIAVGRHNWLFAGSERGAEWAACLFSIIGTCKHNKINPWDYLTDILKRIQGTRDSEIHSLTPREWQKQKDARM